MSPGTVAMALAGDGRSQPWELYELSIVAAVFGTPQPDLHDPWYELRLCSLTPVERSFGYGVSLTPTHGLAELVTADTVIVPSIPERCLGTDFGEYPELVDALRQARANGARMVALCDGAFALAAAGILDGRRATAHWEHTPILAERYPKVTVDDAVLYIDDGDVLTSAGMTAALDLCLHLVRRDLGAVTANRLARRMVVPPHRAGGQAQYIDLSVPVTEDDGIGGALQWANANLDRPLTVDDMARRANLGPRSFYRRVHAATGTTPLKWLLNQRLVHAQSMLETSDAPIEKIARLSGLGTAANLRRHFTAHIGVSPAEYRRTFRGSRVIADASG
ncbi:GlxA family transcriptional regulator [Stackebrandtia nassauensis]|uniref:Transcriptional regulator, AraC family n=1 Tax=Stackebrandtia nassauensis (strain DSM 44728 / CIP 108903 / NRRL B-16338 / NBRC 102104 / LLR-40K-21) TaxID=446470 RepID=D3Q3R9_STANL|nr:helix-turn-helix domain-containing protein [Stackebrandtia nassauensis]ADD43986.1 transcriptional regulator, AraC family [Stackebrandtia nassauensis DSM 44728]